MPRKFRPHPLPRRKNTRRGDMRAAECPLGVFRCWGSQKTFIVIQVLFFEVFRLGGFWIADEGGFSLRLPRPQVRLEIQLVDAPQTDPQNRPLKVQKPLTEKDGF